MSTATGVVTKVHEKTKTNAGKFMKSPAYSIQLNDDTWYSLGFDRPAITEGNVVEFPFEQDQYGNKANANSIKVVESSSPKAAGSTNPGLGFAGYNPDARQNSIVYQSSLKIAVELLPFLVEQGAVKMPKAADAYDFTLDVLDDLAKRIGVRALAPDFTVQEEDVPLDE